MVNTDLKDKVVLVTGAQRDIGAATVKAFTRKGCAVFIHYLRIFSRLGYPLDSRRSAAIHSWARY